MIALEKQPRTTDRWGPQALQEIREARRQFQDANASRRDDWVRSNKYFYDCLKRMLRFIVEPGKRVLDIRCQTGFLLESVRPSRGVGIEISESMVACAQQQHPEMRFVRCDP